jgi:hypothetical protein
MSMTPTLEVPADQLPREFRWISMSSPETADIWTPRFRLLSGPVELSYDPDDQPTRRLIATTEPPDVL